MKQYLQVVLVALGLVGIGIVIGVVLNEVLKSSGFTPKEINVGQVVFDIPTSKPQTPEILEDFPTSTREPSGPYLQSLGLIRVFGNSNQGAQIQIGESGIYRFLYQEGAYATYPLGSEPPNTDTWLTSVYFFRGDRALWDETKIKFEDAFLRLADTRYWPSAADAEVAAKGQYLETQLSQGDIVTLIAVDHLDAYADNPGQVVIEWFLVRY